jgi:hypothetical protein
MNETTFGTVIPAQPGWFVLHVSEDKSEPNKNEVWKEGIVAWCVESGKTKQGEYMATTTPIVAEGTPMWSRWWILEPTGRVVQPHVTDWPSLADFTSYVKSAEFAKRLTS